MNREETKKAIEVMQAFVNGETIQERRLHCRPGTQDDQWVDMHATSAWDWMIFDYRIKPEPMEIEVWIKEGKPWAFSFAGDPALDPRFTKKKFREVIE